MKRTLLLLLLAISPQVTEAQSPPADWREAREFHAVFSPIMTAADENNLEPARSRMAELEEKSRLLSGNGIPQRHQSKEAVFAAGELYQHCRSLSERIKADSASDKDIAAELRRIRDVYRQMITPTP